jgi:glycosyltransferase involved in cell wall biosynthesis
VRVILPSDVYPPNSGGAGWSAHALALALGARGHRAWVVVPREGGPPRQHRQLDGVPILEVGYWAPRAPILRNYFRHERLWPRLADAIAAVAREEAGGGATVVHAQHVQSTPASLLAGRRLGLPVVATVRDHWPWHYFNTGLHGDRLPYDGQSWASLATELAARLGPLGGAAALPALPYLLAHVRRRAAALAACDAVIAVSGYLAGRLARLVPAERLHIIPNMVDLARLDKLLAEPEARAAAQPYLLFVGKLEHNKGAHLLPEVLAAARAALPKGHPALERLVVAGNGPLRAELERALPALGVQGIFLDWASHDEVLRLMARCAALVFPSAWGEPLSRVLIEAAACAAPIVAMASGGTPDIVEHGVSGLLAATPAELGRHLATLLANQELRQALAAGARHRVQQRFAAPVVVQQVEHMYASLRDRRVL